MSENIDQPIAGESTEEPKKGGILGIFESAKAKDAQKVVALTEQVTELDAENTALHEAVAKLQSSEAKLQSELEGLQSDYDAKLAEIEELEGAVKSATASAGQQAAQIAAQSHVAPEDLPAAASSETENAPANEAELEEALAGCESHAERSELVKQYRNRSNN
jgi:predicted  nucleic acid-binding Zn-ribbon protein